MSDRRGEKIGWVGGWIGGFLWVFIMAIIWFIKGHTVEGITGLVLVGIAVAVILLSAPWRHPGVQYYKLLLPVFVVLVLSIVRAAWLFKAISNGGLELSTFWWVIFLVIPFGIAGNRTWNNSGKK
jgi:hypothetical protein